ncbi:MAG TPA: prolipoprotein diacylglyceryl transferase [Niabella sp.]|nr:prolipoprotein diacylglyceryl transferase [Niabella sp.]
MEKVKTTISKILYGAMFCVLLPYLLFLWANHTEYIIYLPVKNIPFISLSLVFGGCFLMLWAMWSLWKRGKGLPMNAFPPQKYVQSGAYKYFHHPIYIGAIVFFYGLALFYESAAGFWFVGPMFTLLILTYVAGYEREIIEKAFPGQKHKTFFDLPENNLNKACFNTKLKTFLWIYLPWFIIYELFILMGPSHLQINSFLPADEWIPFIPSTILLYLFSYFYSLFIPFILNTNKRIRQFVTEMTVAMFTGFLCYLCLPFVAYYQYPLLNNPFYHILLWDKSYDSIKASFPSFHVIWALMAARYFSYRYTRLKPIFYLLAIAIAISCLTTKNHSIIDVVMAFIIYGIAVNQIKIYKRILAICNRIGNSWKEWHWGNIRLINHGLYAGLSGFAGFIIMMAFLPGHTGIVYAIGCAGFVGAGLWAQFIEGSPSLLRPFGYYGAVAGILITVIVISLFNDINLWILAGTAVMAAPVIQAIGRLRCLVQGCCHGKAKPSGPGLQFNHEKSRVNKISGLKGSTLYPTQLYSIASNMIIFFILIRILLLNLPVTFMIGVYLILNGASRFIEESLRGETQTPYFMNMRVYQWLALCSIISGAVITCIFASPMPNPTWNNMNMIHAVIYGIIVTAVYGLDFPESNTRFSRLTQ